MTSKERFSKRRLETIAVAGPIRRNFIANVHLQTVDTIKGEKREGLFTKTPLEIQLQFQSRLQKEAASRQSGPAFSS